ncbi:hypothetical protein MGN70_009429 [Eutypa lata]|nr:hypothetical protein MGN70_009429 [Eutypa lata]
MASSNGGHSELINQEPLDSKQYGQAANILAEMTDTSYGTKRPDPDLGSSMEVHSEKVKDQIDDAVAKGPKKADEHSGGRVQVAETGDLHDLAAKKQP